MRHETSEFLEMLFLSFCYVVSFFFFFLFYFFQVMVNTASFLCNYETDSGLA